MDEPLTYPREFLERTQLQFLDQISTDLFDEARFAVPVAETLAGTWREAWLVGRTALEVRGSLLGRCALFGTLACLRVVELADGLVREIDANALYPASAVGRSVLELVGLTAYAREQLPLLRDADPKELGALCDRLVVGSRAFADVVGHRHFATGPLIEAAKRQVGESFGDWYLHCSDLTHPNILARAIFEADGTLSYGNFGIDVAEAELLVMIAGTGAHAVVHNCQWLIDWAGEWDLRFPE
jgi:hypothetical protein